MPRSGSDNDIRALYCQKSDKYIKKKTENQGTLEKSTYLFLVSS